jgi:hypothetical protein
MVGIAHPMMAAFLNGESSESASLIAHLTIFEFSWWKFSAPGKLGSGFMEGDGGQSPPCGGEDLVVWGRLVALWG